MFVKYISETQVEKAPKQIEKDSRKFVGFTKAFLAEQGYKPLVVEERIIDDDSLNIIFEAYYVEDNTNNTIIQKWRAVGNKS